MKISNFDPNQKPAPAGNTRGNVAAKPAQAEASAKVELSSAASQLAGVADNGDFDAAKVERIAQAIREGKFEVNAEAIADKLLANTRELLSPRTPH